MSKTGIIIVAILVTLGLTYGLSLLLTRRKTKTGGSVSADDWEVGGRELPLYVVVGTQFATAMGGGILVGQVGNGFNNGLSCLLYGILCQLAFIVLMFIAKWLRSHQFATVPEILTHYTGQSKAVRIIAGMMTIVVPFGWCCSNLTAFAKLYSPITGLSINALIIIMAVLSLFFIIPSGMYYQRILAAKDTNQVRKSLLISAICCMIAYVWAVIVGLSVRSMNPSLEGEMATGWLMDQMPVWVVAVFSGLVVCTILSTISSGVQSVVVNLNRDIYRVVKPDVEDKKAVKVSRILSVVIVFTAALVAMFFPQVLSLLVITYSYSAAGLVCPIFLSYILRKKGIITKNGIVAGMLSGILVCAISMQFNSVVPYVIWGCLASGIAMIVFSKLDKTNPVYLEK